MHIIKKVKMKTKIIIDNMKCGGCEGSIKKGLKSFAEVTEVSVDVEQESVAITHNDNLPVEALKEKLSSSIVHLTQNPLKQAPLTVWLATNAEQAHPKQPNMERWVLLSDR